MDSKLWCTAVPITEKLIKNLSYDSVAHTHNGILFSLKKEGNSDNAKTMMNTEDFMLNEISQ